jgi:cephalosporin hydroxylase
MNNEYDKFIAERISNINTYPLDKSLCNLSNEWLINSFRKKFMYNFDWLGRPIIQSPVDIVAMQELFWKTKPDLIIETGIAHGGSLILSASLLALLDLFEAIESGEPMHPLHSKRKVLGIDIEIRPHNKSAIESHPLSSRIQMLQGSSISPEIVDEVYKIAENYKCILVILDSNHTHDHVLAELNAYAPLTSLGSYCIVFDTIIEDMATDVFHNRPWAIGNNPKTAVWDFIKNHSEFEIDSTFNKKLLISHAPDGFLKRIL